MVTLGVSFRNRNDCCARDSDYGDAVRWRQRPEHRAEPGAAARPDGDVGFTSVGEPLLFCPLAIPRLSPRTGPENIVSLGCGAELSVGTRRFSFAVVGIRGVGRGKAGVRVVHKS